ncbi:autotransporter-associated beta strand repeat-containing protein, partial [Azospirillum sp. RU37A]
TGALTLNGGTLTVTGSDVTIDNAITLDVNHGTVSNANALTLSGVISGDGNLTKTGTGTLTLTGANSYGGTTSINQGTLVAGHNSALGSIAGNTMTGSSGTLELANGVSVAEAVSLGGVGGVQITSGSATLTGNVTLTADARLSASSGTTLTISGTLGGAFTAYKVNNGTVVLSGSNSSSNSTNLNISSGTLSVADGSNLTGGTLTLNTGTLAVTGSDVTLSKAISLTGNSTITNTNAVTLSGAIAGGTNTLTKAGGGTLTLATATSSGSAWNMDVSNGALSIDSADRLGTGAVTLRSATSLIITGATTLANEVSLSGGGTIRADADATLSGVISGSGALTKAGVSTLTLTGTQTGTGGMTVSAGTLAVAADANLLGGTLTLNGGTLTVTGSDVTIDNAITLDVNHGTVSNDNALTLSGVISGAGNLTKTGTGTLTLSGSNSYGGSTTVRDGALSVGADANLGTGALTLNGGTLTVTGSGVTIDNAITLDVNHGTVSHDNALTLSGVISGAGNLTKTGTGTLTLSGSNSYGGSTTVRDGALSVGADANLGTGALTLNGGTLTVTGSGVTIDNAITLDVNHGTVSHANALTLSGVISGAGNLTKTGTGTLTLSGTNSYGGATSISNGTLVVTGALAGTSGVTVSTGASLAGSGTIFAANSSNSVTVNQGATLAPGVAGTNGGVGRLTIQGNLALNGTLALDVAGASAGTGHDQVAINGTLTLGQTSGLDIAYSLTGSAGTGLIIIDNQAAGATLGTIGGTVVEQGPLTSNAQQYRVSYVAGTGNDLSIRTNQDPTVSANPTLSGTEDTVLTISKAALNYADADGDALTSITIISLPSAGTLFLDANGDGLVDTGETVTVNQTIQAADLDAGRLKYLPPLNGNGTVASFQYTVSDGSTASAVATATLSMAAVNDSPVITGTPGGTFAEYVSDTLNGGDPVRFAAGVTVADVDATSFNQGTLTVRLGNWKVADDVLAIGSGSNIAYNAATGEVSLNGTVFGSVTFTTDTSGATATRIMVVNLNAASTAAAVNALLGELTYQNTGPDATDRQPDSNDAGRLPNRSVSIVLNDGGNTGTGLGQAQVTGTIAITPQNDRPTVTIPSGASTFLAGRDAVTVSATLSVADADSHLLTGATITLDGALNGTSEALSLSADARTAAANYGITISGEGSGLITLTGSAQASQYQEVLRGIQYRNSADTPNSGNRSVSFTVTDSGNAVSLVAVRTVDIDTIPTVPVNAGLTLAEGTSAVIGSDLLLANDLQDNVPTLTFTVTSLPVNGALLLNGNALTAGATFTQADITANRLTYQHNGGETAADSISFTVVDSRGGTTSTQTFAITVTPVNDAPTIVTAPTTISVTEDVATPLTGISFADVDAGTGTVSVTLSVGAGSLTATDGSGVSITGADSGTLTLSGSLTAINSFIAAGSVSFQTAANSTDGQTLAITINDGGNTGTGGPLTASSNVAINVTAVNDAPSITAPDSLTVTEDVATALTGISFADVDAGTGTVTVTLSVGAGSLSAVNSDGIGITGSGSGTLTLSGALSDINSFINAGNVRFQTAADSTVSQTLAITINDGGNTGTGGPLSASSNVTLNVTAVNDAPGITVPAALNVTENVATPLTGIRFTDVDAEAGTVTVTLSVGAGSLLATDGSGISITGSGSGTLTLSGALSDINSFVNAGNVRFQTATDSTASQTLAITINDGGNTGTGGPLTASTSVDINVTGVNAAPGINAPGSLTVTEDVATALTGISFSDADAGTGIVTVILSVGAGSLSATDGSGISITGSGSGTLTLSGALSDINSFVNAGSVRFQTAADSTASQTLAITINDGGNTGTGGPLSASSNVTLNVTAVNDAPSINAPGNLTVTEDVATALTGISFSDVDAGTGTVTVTLSVGAGSLSATGGNGIGVTGSGSGTLTLSGSLSDINSFVNAGNVRFQTAANSTASQTLTVSIDDGGNTGTGGPLTASTSVDINVTGVNAAPGINAPGSLTVTEDVATALTGISFSDADAGTGIVTVTLSVGAGSLSATGGNGIGVTGSGSGTLTLSGSLSDINSFVNAGS